MMIGHLSYSYQDDHDLIFSGIRSEYNKVVNCESGSLKTAGNTVYRNYFDGCDDGTELRSGTYNIIEGNYYKSCRYGIRGSGRYHVIVNNVFELCDNGITLKEGSLYSQMGSIYNAQHDRAEEILIAHNTFINNVLRDIYLGQPQTGRNGAGHPQPYSPGKIWIYNNVAVGNAGVRVFFRDPTSVIHADDAYPTTASSGYHRYNDCENKNNTWYVTASGVIGDNTADGGTPTGYINWNQATLTSGSVITGNGETNPNLTATYRLQAGSPAINGGFDFTKNDWSPSTKFDWDNDTRLQGAAPDRGVEEFA